MPTPPPPAKSWSHLRLALQALVVAAALIGCVWIMQASDPAWLAAAQAEPATSGMSWPSWPHNLMPFVLVLLLLLGLTARPMLAALLTLGLVALLYYANAIKLDQLGAPLLPADFALLGNLGKRGGVLLLRYLPRSHASIAFTLAIVTLLFTLLRRERPLPALRRWRRLALAGVAGLLGLSLYRGDPPWQHWYGASADLQVWAPMQHAAQQGLPAHLLLYQWATHTTSAPPDRGAAASSSRSTVRCCSRRRRPPPVPRPTSSCCRVNRCSTPRACAACSTMRHCRTCANWPPPRATARCGHPPSAAAPSAPSSRCSPASPCAITRRCSIRTSG